MASAESLNPSSIDSLEEKLIRDFDRINEKLSSPLVYKDSEGEKIVITKQKRGNKICIFKAADPHKVCSTRPRFWAFFNIKSEYSLIKNSNGSFSLETYTYHVDRDGISHRKSRDKFDNLNLEQIGECLKNFERRIKDAEVFLKEEQDQHNEEKYKKMQQYAYDQENKDKMDADNLINGLDNHLLG